MAFGILKFSWYEYQSVMVRWGREENLPTAKKILGGQDIDLTSKWRFSYQVQANRMTTVVQITYNFNQGLIN